MKRITSVIIGGVIFAAGAYILYLQFTDPEGTRSFILAMGTVLLTIGTWGLWLALKPRR